MKFLKAIGSFLGDGFISNAMEFVNEALQQAVLPKPAAAGSVEETKLTPGQVKKFKTAMRNYQDRAK